MTRLTLATASALALTLAACATTDDEYVVAETTTTTSTQTLSDAQQIGVNDADGYMSTGAEAELDDKFKVDCNDNDPYMAEGCDDAMMAKTTTTTTTTNTAVLSAPAATMSLAALASSTGDLSSLYEAIELANLQNTLDGDTVYTVFAPANSAFIGNDLEDVIEDYSLEKLLASHIVEGRVSAADIAAGVMGTGSYTLTTLTGQPLTFIKTGEAFRVAGAEGTLYNITTADVAATNGVVHIIDGILLPKM